MSQKFKFLLFSCLITFAINSIAISLSSRLTPSVQAIDYRNETLINQTLNSQISNQGKVYVHSFNKKLLVIGYVSDHSASQEIRKVLGSQPSEVTSIFNEVIFVPNFTEPNKNFDNSLRNLLLSRIDNNFPINSTKIIVYDRIVYLMGVITGPEAEYLKKIASTTPNVRQVRAYFDVITPSQADRLAQQIPQTIPQSETSTGNLPACQGNELRLWRGCFGTYIYDNGTEYTGEFNNGTPSGRGTMTNPNGSKYIGQWFHGVRHGVGVQTYTDNRQTQNGVWVNGIFSGGSASISNDGVVTMHSQPQPNTSFSQNQSPSFSQPSQPPSVTNQGRRLALVIGNASYKVRPLLNPRNDADDVSRVLRSTGFEVIDLRDATLAQMRASVRQFGERLMSNDVGLVYYSGHGIEVKGRNYFIPVNADIKASDEVADQALDVSLILAKMDTAKKGVNILIVDACRDDPFGRSFRSNSRGLATMDAPQGTLIAYATAPGSVAADGTGRNSPFTKHLVRAMQVPNTPIELMFKEVRRAVREETKNQQTPWENSSLIGNFYFSVKK